MAVTPASRLAGRTDGTQDADDATVRASQIAAALRERLPGLGRTKPHGLLHCCPGDHPAQCWPT